jgi:PAS domain S-box-containing protein
MKTDEMRHLAAKVTGNAGRSAIITPQEAHHRFRLLATMVQGRGPGAMSTLPLNLPLRILEGSPDAIVMCDHTGTVRFWNAAAERVFGFCVAEALGVSLNLIIPERLRARHWAGWEEAMRTGVTRYGKGQLLAVPALHKDGRRISIEFSIQFIKDTDGQTKWVAAIIRDVTERYLREKALRAQLKPSGHERATS